MAAEVSLRLPVGRLWRRWDRRRELARAQALVPRILAAMPQPPGTAMQVARRVVGSHWTDLNVAVMLVGPMDGPPTMALKLPRTHEGVISLRRQVQVLEDLRAEPLLCEWAGLLPRPLASGMIDGEVYFVESALPGGSAHRLPPDPDARRQLLTVAADAIRRFHTRTASSVVVDTELLDRWIEQPLQRLQRLMGGRVNGAANAAAIRRVETELRDTLLGRRLSASWVHGDYWTGNLLTEPGGSLTGIIDWDLAAPDDLPLRDLLHLLLYTRKLVQRCELGDVVRRLLVAGDWTPHERELIEAMDEALPGDYLSERTRVLIYWLRHVSANLEQSPAYARNWLWVHRNIDNVLRTL